MQDEDEHISVERGVQVEEVPLAHPPARLSCSPHGVCLQPSIATCRLGVECDATPRPKAATQFILVAAFIYLLAT